MKTFNVGVVGATGMVGRKMLEVLLEKRFPIGQLFLYASAKSAGQALPFGDHQVMVEELKEDAFVKRGLQFVLFSAGADVSAKYAPLAAQAGAVAIDNSSYWRMQEQVPLVVPEVNPERTFRHQGIIANPNCSTIQSVMVLKPLADRFGLRRVVYATYQAVSGAGVKGVRDLQQGTADKFPYSIRTSCIPQIDVFLPDGYTKEERKMIQETRKILGLPQLRATATAVRVPIENSHAVNMNIELEKPFALDEVRQALAQFPGVKVEDDPAQLRYPLQANSSGQDVVAVGRIRRDESVENGLALWCTADNIRKGAATNAVQIALLLAERENQ